ncbi:MAG: pyruvate kinase [bacterium]|nr:pyruvate kinase [bacterium]
MKNSKAQIVVTFGPATRDLETVRALVRHQMDVARLNFSWGSYAEHAHYIKTVRLVAAEAERHIPIIQDLSGPRAQDIAGHHFEGGASILTSKDLADLDFGVSQKVDYVAMSYVGSAADIELLKQEIKKRGVSIPIIAKIERRAALDNLSAIIKASDAIMVARGDLGNEVPLETIPFIQQRIVQAAKKAKKPVITATQMMLSMVENPVPTRAEVSDVAYAILNGSDAVMLSEETARGRYPVEAVAMMEKIVKEAEKHEKKLRVRKLSC